LLLSFAFSSGSHAQSVPQKAPVVTFHFSGDTNTNLLANGKFTDEPLNVECACLLYANLTQIPNCVDTDTLYRTYGNGEKPLDENPCCCVDLAIWDSCQGLCGFDVTFDNGNFDPLCICPEYALPPGWTLTQDPDGELHLNFSGTDCSGSVGEIPVHFKFCGYNSPGSVGYTVCGYYCSNGGPSGGGCVPAGEFCCQHFYSTINCGTGPPSSVTSSTIPFSVEDGFPNPATSSIRFDYSTPFSGVLSCTLIDVLGETVSTSTNNISMGTGNVTIGLNGAQPGVYYCVFEFSGQHVTKRIVVK
jgi:hypothetical protein